MPFGSAHRRQESRQICPSPIPPPVLKKGRFPLVISFPILSRLLLFFLLVTPQRTSIPWKKTNFITRWVRKTTNKFKGLIHNKYFCTIRTWDAPQTLPQYLCWNRKLATAFNVWTILDENLFVKSNWPFGSWILVTSLSFVNQDKRISFDTEMNW